MSRARVAALTLPLLLAVPLVAVAPSAAVDNAHISGTVTDGTTGLAGIYVEVYRWDGTDTTFVSTTNTGADGSYDLGGLMAGTYRVKFADYVNDVYPDEWYDDARTAQLASDVVVAEDAVVTVDEDLAPGGNLSGTLTDVDGGAAVPGIAVELNERIDNQWIPTVTAFSDASGSYAFEVIPAGTYRLGFLDYAASAYVTEYYEDATTVGLADDVVVPAGQTTDVDATLSRARPVESVVPPRISGRAEVGRTLSASPGTWDPADVSLRYRWRIGSTQVSGPRAAPSACPPPPVASGCRPW